MGTNFINPISRGSQPFYNESSVLRTPRDSDSLHRSWKKNAIAANQTFRLSQSVEQIQRELNRLRVRRGQIPSISTSHPFKITQGTSWLEFNIAPGYVITTGAPFLPTGITELDGTLHTQTITSPYPQFFFVLAILSASTAAVTATSSITSSTFSTDNIPLGWVDTSTDAATEQSTIYQFWRDNVFSPCVV